MSAPLVNPFRYGALALDDAFTDREAEVAELVDDARNGQDVVLFAPRRYGKSSLVWRVAQQLVAEKLLVAQLDLMTTPTRAQLAARLAKTIHDDLATPLFRARERLRVFAGLRVAPTISVDPEDGSVGFSFSASVRREDLDATIERLLELPGRLAAERNRRVVLILDEFQEVVDIDAGLPKLMRAVFQRQPEVCHLYLGSRRHMVRRIFSDANEPFWRSAKQLELDVIAPAHFRGHIAERFRGTGRRIGDSGLDAVLGITHGHPYATQELCYFTWQETPARGKADAARVARALAGVLRSEHAHFSLAWSKASGVQRTVLQALAREPGHALATEYRARHGLPAASSVQKALDALERDELVGRRRGHASITEPFLAEWLLRQ
ncbi:MAG: AAA family ATPase [Solirubrobacteraceae bacterium]